MGFDEAQILEIAQAEKVIQYLIDQYILNQRLKCFSLEASNWDEYMRLKHDILTMENFREFMHQLPIQKREYDIQEHLKKVEEEAQKEADINRGIKTIDND